MSLSIVILAAGQGKRMRSQLPKVLHKLAGKTLLEHVVQTAQRLSTTSNPIVVYGHQGDLVKEKLSHLPVVWAEQTKQLGTGHAVLQALDHIQESDQVLILYGDVPLITQETLANFIQQTPQNALGIMTAHLPNPAGLGRIMRDANQHIQKIVEDKDANSEEKQITEINTGIYLVPAILLKKWLPQLTPHNAQKEYYLTDIITMAHQENVTIASQAPYHYQEILGINDLSQLANAERFYQRSLAEKLMRDGVMLCDPNRLDVRGEITVGTDTMIDANVIIEGRVVIGDYCTIGPNTYLKDVTIKNHVNIKANSFVEGAEIEDHCVIGPFARIRQGSIIAANAQVGNFAEIKNSRIGQGTKVHHVSYLGDSEIGAKVNIGAGTITCNYDGVSKYKTIIGDGAFIGSNTELVAPVTIGEHAVIGAGSTIRDNAPPNKLTVTTKQQRTIENWQKKTKKTEET